MVFLIFIGSNVILFAADLSLRRSGTCANAAFGGLQVKLHSGRATAFV
jgi:hypothetical protein